jgi:hypothetical protein
MRLERFESLCEIVNHMFACALLRNQIMIIGRPFLYAPIIMSYLCGTHFVLYLLS